MEEIVRIFIQEFLLEPRVRACQGLFKRGIHLNRDLFEFDRRLVVLSPEHPPLLEDHLYDKLMRPAD